MANKIAVAIFALCLTSWERERSQGRNMKRPRVRAKPWRTLLCKAGWRRWHNSQLWVWWGHLASTHRDKVPLCPTDQQECGAEGWWGPELSGLGSGGPSGWALAPGSIHSSLFHWPLGSTCSLLSSSRAFCTSWMKRERSSYPTTMPEPPGISSTTC